LDAGTERELRVAADAWVAGGRLAKIDRKIVIFHLGGERGGERPCIEKRDGRDSRCAREQALPYCFDIVAEGGYPTDAGDDDAFTHGECPSGRSRVG